MLKIQIALNRLPSTESPWQKIRNMEILFGKTSRQVICTRIISNIYAAYRYSYIFNYIYIYIYILYSHDYPMFFPCFFSQKNTSYPSWDEIPFQGAVHAIRPALHDGWPAGFGDFALLPPLPRRDFGQKSRTRSHGGSARWEFARVFA